MEPDRPDPGELIRDLVRRLPEDVRRRLGDWLREMGEVVRPAAEVMGSVDVVVQPDTAVAHGTAYPPTVRTVELGGTVEAVAEMTGSLTVTPGAVPGSLMWRQDLLIVAVVVLVVLSFSDRSFTEGVAELLRELARLYIELALGTAFLRRQ